MKRLILIGLLLLAACATTETTTDEGYTIGFIGPLTGEVAFLGEAWQDAVQMAADDINAAGGINGKPVEIVFEDGQCSGKQASTALQKLQNTHDLDAVIPYCSPEVLAIAPITAQTNTLMVAPGATAPDITNAGPHVFRLAPSDALQGVVVAQLLKEREFERVGILYLNNDYGAALKDIVAGELGNTIIGIESHELDGASDVRTQLTKLQNADMDALFLATFPKPGSMILEQMAELGIGVQIVATEAIKGEEVLPVGEGMIFTAPSMEGDTYEDFAARYEERFGRKTGIFDGELYDAVYVIKQAIETNPEDPVAGMAGVPEFTGVAGHVVFDENGDVVKPYDVFTVEDGAFVKIGQVSLS